MAYSIALDPYGHPSAVVSGATGTGTGASQLFAVQTSAEGTGSNVTLQADVAGGTLSALVGQIQGSLDGGVTFGLIQDAFSSPGTMIQLTPGAIYQINISTFTTATGTPVVTVYASAM